MAPELRAVVVGIGAGEVAEGGDGQRHVAHLEEPEHDDRRRDTVDLAAQAVIGGVDELEDLGRKGLVGGDVLAEVDRGGVGVGGGGEDFGEDGGERGQAADALDGLVYVWL